jgi:hypothetical protein
MALIARGLVRANGDSYLALGLVKDPKAAPKL